MINISNEDIQYAENILFGRTSLFDDERIKFIKNLETIDLQAVPGSGKTTALLAKLLIIEKYMPFSDGSGILVLSHTNSAVDEIKERIGKYCPKIFSYPNFVGTIQSFVDNFLAIPYYVNHFKTKPYRIDDEIYYEKCSIVYKSLRYGTKEYLRRKKGENATALDFFVKIKKDIENNLLRELNGQIFLRNTSSSNSYKDILQKKDLILKDWGVLSYDDAYLLAEEYLNDIPYIKDLLQKRFKYVFVDEMQDMDIHQYELLEKIFYNNGKSNSIYQRIGDKNQAIYRNKIKLDNIWQQRNIQYIKGSHRLTPQIASIVERLALTSNEVIGLNKNEDETEINIKPHIIVFDDNTTEQVIPKFAEIIKGLQDENKIPREPKHKFMAIGWIKEPNGDNRIAISSYWIDYSLL
jgi:superfamily I DNA/RNA helicase